MILEILACGFPLIHNGERWSDHGYFYKENDITVLHKCMEAAVQHVHNVERITSHAQALFWRYSIHNPQVQKAWFELLGGKQNPT